MQKLGLAKRSLILISILIFFLVIGSVFIVYYQEEEVTMIHFGPQRMSPELKARIIEQGLSKVMPLEQSLKSWDSISQDSSILSNFLYSEASIKQGSPNCIPEGFGYTRAEADLLFDPDAYYPDCSMETPVTVKLEGQKLMKVCEDMEYCLGTNPEEERFGRVPYYFKWEKMAGNSVDTENKEFAFIKCGRAREAIVFFKRNNKAAARASELTKKLASSISPNSNPKPITVFMLIFDSLSRNHMYRNFPETLKFLNNSIGSGKYSDKLVMYDFLINHAHGENTIPNMIPFLFGYNFNYHKIRLGNRSHLDPNDNDYFVYIQKDALWKHFEKLGYVTMFGFDVIWDFLVPAVGREIKTDHVFTNFWKASSKVFGTDNYINEQGCFGSFDSHRYMLDYVQSFLNEYKGINRFGYVHITTAHEKSGTIIKTVDDDLVEFFEEALELFYREDEDVFFILAGDHGKHVSESDFVRPGWLENMMPGHIVITNKDLMKKLRADENMKHNTQRLVSRPDWHLTMKHISTVPYGDLPKDSALYTHWKKLVETDSTISLLMEKVPDSRTCQDVNIEEYFCTCLPYEELSLSESLKNDYIKAAINYSLDSVNRSIKNSLCQSLSFNSILYSAIRKIHSDYDIYRLRVTVNESPNVVIEIFASIFPIDQGEKYTRTEFGFAASDFEGNSMYPSKKIQLLKVVRIDEYGGYMEEFSVVLNEKPHFCIPKLPEDLDVADLLDEKMSDALELLIEQIDLRTANKLDNCFTVCKENDQICQPWALQLFSNDMILFPIWKSTSEIAIKSNNDKLIKLNRDKLEYSIGDYLAFSNSTIFYPQGDYNCFSVSSTLTLICPCKK